MEKVLNVRQYDDYVDEGFEEDYDVGYEGAGEDSASFVIDFETIDENKSDFEAIPVGVYDAIVENVELTKSKKLNDMVVWTFKLIDEKYGNRLLSFYNLLNEYDDSGKTVRSERGLKALKKVLLRVCPDTPLAGLNIKAFCEQGEAINLRCRVKVTIQKKGEYAGRNNVQDVLRPSADDNYLD